MPDDPQYTIDDFAEALIREKNYKTLTPAMHDELKKDILERAQDYLIAHAIDKLSDSQAVELNTLLDKHPSDEELQKFIAGAIPDAPTFIGNALFQFRQTYLGLL